MWVDVGHVGVVARAEARSAVARAEPYTAGTGASAASSASRSSKTKHSPSKWRAAGLLEVLQDAAFELQHVLDAGVLQEQRRLLAADAAGAVAHHRLALHLLAVRERSACGNSLNFADAPVAAHPRSGRGRPRRHCACPASPPGGPRRRGPRRASAPSVAASTAGARAACGRMAGWFMRMISRLTFTSSLPKGSCAGPAFLRRQVGEARVCAAARSTKPRTACGSPARNRLMPSSASSTVPFSPARRRLCANALAQRRRVGQRHEPVGGDVEDGVHA